MSYRRVTFSMNLLLLFAAVAVAHAAEPAAQTALDRYVKRPDPSYRWKLVSTLRDKGFTTYVVDVTSQSWRTTRDVDRTTWKHHLVIVKPDAARGDTAMLFIGGGSNRDGPPRE
ncbi:MAG: PhoPQ-activated protein PqaA family protein, partial [Planctomycetota bacterium]